MSYRKQIRVFHLVGAFLIGAGIYSDFLYGQPLFLMLLQFLIFPLLGISGIWLWKGAAIRNRFKNRLVREAHHEKA